MVAQTIRARGPPRARTRSVAGTRMMIKESSPLEPTKRNGADQEVTMKTSEVHHVVLVEDSYPRNRIEANKIYRLKVQTKVDKR